MTAAAESLEPYLQALLEENRSVNVTGIRDLEMARVLHVLDSLAIDALSLSPARCLDLGTGNGFPGVALRALFEDAEVVLLDRTAKKLRAIERAIQTSGVERVQTLHADASVMPNTHQSHLRSFDLITARAVGKPPAVAMLAAPLIAPDGDLVLWLDEATTPPRRLPRFELRRVHDYVLPAPAERRRRLAHYRTLSRRD